MEQLIIFLRKMYEEDMTFEEALKEAQNKGIAETNLY